MIQFYKMDESSEYKFITRELFPDFKFFIVRWRRYSMWVHWRGIGHVIPMPIQAWFRRQLWKAEELWSKQLNGPYRFKRLKLHLTGQYAPYYVNVYDVDQQYGGPEEGGWWYGVGEPSSYFGRACFPCESLEDAQRLAESLRAKIEYPEGHHNQWSVLSDGDVEVNIEEDPAEAYPQQRPYYC